MFPKIGVPQNGWFIVETPIKMDDLGVPPFKETPKLNSQVESFADFRILHVPPVDLGKNETMASINGFHKCIHKRSAQLASTGARRGSPH